MDQVVYLLSLILKALTRRTAPWHEIGYAQKPNVVVTGLSGTEPTWTPIAPNNPNRVALILSTSAPLKLTPDSSIPTTAGIVLSATISPFVLKEADFLNLATVQLFGFASQGTTVTAVEVTLREWPVQK